MLVNDKTKPTARKIGLTKSPLILFTLSALVKMRVIVDECPQEVGWYGIVEKREENVLVIDDILLLKQEVNGGTCELDESSFAELYQKMVEEGREEDVQKLRFWGHSHAGGGVTPSGQDEKQAMETLNDTRDYLIRAICNKDGKMAVSYFNYERGEAIDNVDWQCDDGVDKNAIREALLPLIKENVKELKYTDKKAYNATINNNYQPANNYNRSIDSRPDLIRDFNQNRRNGKKNNRTKFTVLN